MRIIVSSSFFLFSLVASGHALTLPKIFKDDMVLQAQSAVIWGFLDGNSQPVDLQAQCVLRGMRTTDKKTFIPSKEDDKFKFEVPNGEHTRCDFTFTQGEVTLKLQDVIYGDVWICSGQSNMQWNMGGIFNSSQEIDLTKDYPNIRMYKLKLMTSDSPQEDLMQEDFTKWARSNEADYVKAFSAVCLLTARYMADTLGKDKVFGLIETNWGGTIIEAWMPQEPLDACGIEPHVNENSLQNSNSYLYNAMIHPLIRLSIKGALWYQGEANAGWNRDKYQCTFPAMISEWRKLWSTFTPTSDSFPFGFMQLSTNQANDLGPGFPVIRWHQTADKGFVPNDQMPNVFMGVACDTYDKESGIHPRNKQTVSKRLAIAGLNIAYGQNALRVNGPFPEAWNFATLEDGIQADILYDQPFTWDPIESEGFYVCCEESAEKCNSHSGGWQRLPDKSVVHSDKSLSMKLPSCAKSLAYLWETTPVLGMEALPIYADDPFGLPAAPWMRAIN